MDRRTLKFERDDECGWTFKLLDERDLPVLVSLKSYDRLDDAVEDIRDLVRFVDEI
jgi:hypothetical protein